MEKQRKTQRQEMFDILVDEFKKLGKTEEYVYKYVDAMIERNEERGQRILNFKDLYSKLVFVTINEVHSANHDVTQLSVTIADTLHKDFTDGKFLDRHYYSSEKYDLDKELTKKLRKKSRYPRTFNEDKQNVLKFIGDIDKDTIIVLFNSKNVLDVLPELKKGTVFDLFTDTTHNMQQPYCPLIPLANTLKVNFDAKLLYSRTAYEIGVIQNTFYNYVYFKGMEPIEFNTGEEENEK